MHQVNSILIRGKREEIVRKAADLEHWPDFLSHYRYNRFLSPMPWGGIVKMAAVRTGIPLAWVSVFRVDYEKPALYFEHLKPTTRGMKVVWDFKETSDGVLVSIDHEFKLSWPVIGTFVADVIIGKFLIDYVATRTLRGLKRAIEGGVA